jgi:hypothetical protein
MAALQIVNVDHHRTMPGGLGQPYDRAVVVDHSRKEKHIITGELQSVIVYRGDLAGAHRFVKEAR